MVLRKIFLEVIAHAPDVDPHKNLLRPPALTLTGVETKAKT